MCFLLDLEMAVAYWNLVLSGRFKFLDLWNRFLLVSLRDGVNGVGVKFEWFRHRVHLHPVTVGQFLNTKYDLGVDEGQKMAPLAPGAVCDMADPCASRCVYRHLSPAGTPQTIHPQGHVELTVGLWKHDCRRHVKL